VSTNQWSWKNVLIEKKLLIGFMLVIIVFFSAINCNAEIEQLAMGAKSISLGNAVTAYPLGLLSIHYNPAGLSHLKGKHFDYGITYVSALSITSRLEADPDFEGFFGFTDDPLAGTEGIAEPYAKLPLGLGIEITVLAVPFIGISYNAPGSRWTLAYGVYPTVGLGFYHPEEDDPMRFGGKSLYLMRLLLAAPAVSYKVSKSLSVGLSAGLGDVAMGLEMDMRAPNDLLALTRVLGELTEDIQVPILLSQLTLPYPWFGGGINPYEQIGAVQLDVADHFTTSYNLGLLWEPLDWFSAGIVYQSESKAKMSGPYELEYGEDFQNLIEWLGSTPLLLIVSAIFDLPYEPVQRQEGRATLEIVFPQRAQCGIMLRPFKRLRLMCDLHWNNWSEWENLTVVFDQEIQLVQLAKLLGYQPSADTLVFGLYFMDTLHLSYGLELQVLDRLFLRLGYEPKESMIPDRYFPAMLPLPVLTIYGAGVGLTLNRSVSLDLAVMYVDTETKKVPNNSSRNLNSTVFTDLISIMNRIWMFRLFP
jgi:long-subunit fatty acid transport protein